MHVQIRAYSKFLVTTALAVYGAQASGQTFVYVESNNAACPVVSMPPQPIPKTVKSGGSVVGSIRVSCSFTEGSYTVTLSSTDPSATFSPKSFLVNFGNLSGSGAFSAKFATVGEQTVFATFTPNMGSPVLTGKFVGTNNIVNVVSP
jgi:hypothetical protein